MVPVRLVKSAPVVKPAAARDEAKRGCLLDAWQAGKAARLSLRVSTIEGDPMVYVLEVVGPASLRVTRDTSQDRFGPRAVTTFVCASLERELGEGGEKRGFVAYVCESLPDRHLRLKIDHQVTKSSKEHFVIYCDKAAGLQVWHWVRRETGKPSASRDHRFETSQSGDRLIQRLEQIAVSLDEEDAFTLVDATAAARAAFDVDRVTKRFYDQFKTCLLYTSPTPRDRTRSRMPSSA